MKKIFLSVILFFFPLLFSATAFAEKMPVEAGKITVYKSPNGRYTVTVTAQVLGGGLSSCALLEGEQVISSKRMDENPGKIAVSDNGETIAMLNWGWEDEGGSRSISFYDPKWNLIKETSFGGDFGGSDKGAMKWIDVLTLSPDGSYAAIGDGGKEISGVSLFNAKTGEWLWGKQFGLEDIREIAISKDGQYILITTYERGQFNVLVQLLDLSGNVLREKTLPKAFSYDVKNYFRFTDDGKGFEVFDKEKGTFSPESFPAPFLESVKTK